MRTVRCRYCQESFQPSRYHSKQKVCCQPECRRRRRPDYHRHKRQTDAEYRQTCRDSQQKWRAEHPDYQRQYWRNHEQEAERNRQLQRQRDQRRRAQNLVKNNLALDLKRFSAGV